MSAPLPAPKDPPLPYMVTQHADGFWLVRRPDGTPVAQFRECGPADMHALALNRAFREGELAEREACARVAETRYRREKDHAFADCDGTYAASIRSDGIAREIRERSKA